MCGSKYVLRPASKRLVSILYELLERILQKVCLLMYNVYVMEHTQ